MIFVVAGWTLANVVGVEASGSFTSMTVTKWLGFANKSLWLFFRSRSIAVMELSLILLSFISIAGISVFAQFSPSASCRCVSSSCTDVTDLLLLLLFTFVESQRRPWIFDDNSLMNWLSAPSLRNCTSSVSFSQISSPSISFVVDVAGVEAARINWFCVNEYRKKSKERSQLIRKINNFDLLMEKYFSCHSLISYLNIFNFAQQGNPFTDAQLSYSIPHIQLQSKFMLRHYIIDRNLSRIFAINFN